MFTCVFTNKYSDTSFKIVNFSRFLFITCTRNKTFSEEIEERRRDIALFTAIFIYVKSSSATRKTKVLGHAQNGLEITFKVLFVMEVFVEFLVVYAIIRD